MRTPATRTPATRTPATRAVPRRGVLARAVAAAGAALLGTALLGTSCGVIADDVAASYGDSEISTDVVDTLAADEAFSQLFGFPVGSNEDVVVGSTARTVLDFLLEGTALVQVAESEGIEVEADRDALAATIAGLQQQGYAYGVEDLSDAARDFLARFVVADQALSASGFELDAPDDEDLRFVYEETAPSGRWERTCVTMVAASTEDGEAVEDALDDGVELAEVPGEVEQAQLVLDAGEACATATDLAPLPPEVGEAIASAPEGRLVGPVETQAQGAELVVFLEVGSTGTVTLEQAREELEAEVARSALAVSIARESEVNPRYGDGVGLEAASGPTGEPSLVARVERPQAPPGIADPPGVAPS